MNMMPLPSEWITDEHVRQAARNRVKAKAATASRRDTLTTVMFHVTLALAWVMAFAIVGALQ